MGTYDRLFGQTQQEGLPALGELGDPNFSPSDSSQGQVPGAAAQARIFDNQTKAQNLIQRGIEMGYDVSAPNWENVHSQAETGFVQEAGSILGSLVGWIDGPRQAVNLLIQDMIGGEAEEGYSNPNFGDYWTTFWGGVNDADEFEARTGLNPVSGSHTLDMFGWEEEESLGGRVMRGVADFGLQIVTDPLSYVTFGLSGLGKKAALAAGQSLQKSAVQKVMMATRGQIDVTELSSFERWLFESSDDIFQEFQDDLVRKGVEVGGELPPDMVSALERWFGDADGFWSPEKLMETALANKVHKEVIQPLVSRDFAALNSLAQETMPLWARGGARVSIPFTRSGLEKGWMIPGSQGVGRKLVGDPMRNLSSQMKKIVPGYEFMADTVSKGVSKMDQMAPIMRALKNGEIEGWQFHIFSNALDNMHNNAAKHTISTELNSQWNHINELAEAAGTDLSEVSGNILHRLEIDDDIMDQQIDDLAGVVGADLRTVLSDPALDEAVGKLVKYMQTTMKSYHEALGVLDPTFAEKYIRGYIPHTVTKKSRRVVTALAGTAAGTKPGEGNQIADMVSQLLNAAGRGGVAEPAMGTARHDGRRLGRVQSLTDDGALLLHRDDLTTLGEIVGAGGTETRYLSVTQLNDMLAPELIRLAREHNVPVPKNWDGRIFNENPIDTMIDYLDNMTDAINAWSTIDTLKASGLAFKHFTELDVHATVQAMMANLVRNTGDVPTTAHGRPKIGERTNAPVEWLNKIADPENVMEARANLASSLDPTTKAAMRMERLQEISDLEMELAMIDNQITDIEVDFGVDPDMIAANKQATDYLEAQAEEVRSMIEQLRAMSDEEYLQMQNLTRDLDEITDASFQGADEEVIQGLMDKADDTFQAAFDQGVADKDFRLASGEITRDAQAFKEDVLGHGIQDPIIVEIYPNGGAQILDGHHRLEIANEAGIESVPVVFRRGQEGSDYRVPNDVRVQLKPGWYDEGVTPNTIDDPIADLAQQIMDDPGSYVFHVTTRLRMEGVNKTGLKGGGLVGYERAKNHGFGDAGHGFSDPTQAVWLVFRKEDIHPFQAKQLDKSDYYSGDQWPEGVPGIKPVGYIPYEEGGNLEDTLLGRIGMRDDMAAEPAMLDDMTTYEGYDVLDVLPWGPKPLEGKSVLHGGRNQIPGVDETHRIAATDSEVLHWETLEDVADSRQLVNNLKGAKHSDWSTDPGNPDPSMGGDDAADVLAGEQPTPYRFSERTDGSGTHTILFGQDEIDVEQISRLKDRELKEQKRRKARRAAKDPGSKKPAPVLRITARGSRKPGTIKDGKALAPHSAKLRFVEGPALSKHQKSNARRAAINWLDKNFKDGGIFEGHFTAQGIQDIIDGGLDDYTARILFDYVNMKVQSLGRDTVEFLSGEPAELFATRAQWNAFEDGIMEVVTNNAAVRNVDGTLRLADDAKILGTKELHAKLRGLSDAAKMLGSKGYDHAVDIMQDVEVYTGVKALADYVQPSHFNLAGPAVDDLQIQQDIAEWLSLTASNMGSIYTPEGIAAAKLAVNETLKWWRAMATIPRPAFHIRNLVGGSWMNLNFGVKSETMAKAMRYGMAFRKALSEVSGEAGIEQAFNRLPAEMRNAWRAAWDHNVLAGFATTEFSSAVKPRTSKNNLLNWVKATDVDNWVLTRAGSKVMETVEDFLRMSLFLQYYDETVAGSAKTAADIVNAVHFNYSQLTPTETKLKSLIPFFVWTRRNLPLQVQTAVENPRYVQRYGAMMRSLNDNFGGNDPSNLQEGDHFSAYAAGTNYKVGAGTPFWARVMIDPDLPISDLLDLPNPEPGALVEYANGLLGPHVSSLVDIQTQRELGDVNAPAPFNLIMQGMAAMGFYDRTADGDVRIPYHMRTVMETALPFTRDLVDPVTGGPTDPNRQQRWGIGQDDGFVESTVKSVGSSLAAGLGIKLTTPADARAAAYRSDAEIDALVKSLRLQGEAPPAER